MQPQSPSPNYDFIMNAGQKPKGSWLPALPRPALIGLGAALGLFILMVLLVVFGGKGSTSQGVQSVAARAQEIARVCNVAASDTNDSNVKALAATVATTLSSQETQLNAYWTSNNHKVDPKTLAIYQNKSVDAQLQSAVQNNNFAAVFNNYLKTNLRLYQTQLAQTYQSTSSTALHNVLSSANASVQTILDSSF